MAPISHKPFDNALRLFSSDLPEQSLPRRIEDESGAIDQNSARSTITTSRIDLRRERPTFFQNSHAQGFCHLDQTNRAMDSIARNAYSGIAAATALTMIPEVDQGKNFALGMGASTYRGYQAIAICASARVNDRVKLKAGVGMSSASATAGVGASMQW